ncbi:MAG: anhydro-N-acetylmuramic acid kinase [Bacteroidetes bacterium]|nr:anhydro-N-acetylmuramic acid kinase [Bacteroidota bacterium]
MASIHTSIGLMSGTSLDGLDMIAVEFTEQEGRWDFNILAAECISYDHTLEQQLKEASKLPLEKLMELHTTYGKFLGECAREFMDRQSLFGKIDLICSHGHTVLHDPAAGYTLQIGDGAQVTAQTGTPTVSDLRTKDVAMGGQGAPIVPVGEKHLFTDYNMFLNIGGIANISHHKAGNIKAYDISPGNTPLNLLAQQQGSDYDEEGRLARAGILLPELFTQLETFPFYARPVPRSLHTDTIKTGLMPMIDLFPGSLKDKLHTVTEHIAMEISKHINLLSADPKGQILVTGGGARNTYLIERIGHFSQSEIVIPDSRIIDYKEAVVMAFFGILRLRGEVNCLASVTGARADSVGGALYT